MRGRSVFCCVAVAPLLLGTLLLHLGAPGPGAGARAVSAAAQWHSVKAPAVPGGDASLLGLTCTSDTSCLAVGVYQTVPLIEAYSGSSWTVSSSPPSPSPGLSYTELSGVSCSSAGSCLAVGQVGAEDPILDRLSGGAWNAEQDTAKETAGEYSPTLSGISCESTGDCLLVGATQSGPLIEDWNGSSDAIVQAPKIPGLAAGWQGQLASVSCISSGNCWAVGEVRPLPTTNSNYYSGRTLVLREDAGTWEVDPSPNLKAVRGDYLSSVSCEPQGTCWAVGDGIEKKGGYSVPLLLQRSGSGSWRLVPEHLPGRGSAVEGALAGISCPPGGPCIAVGEQGAEGRPLIESITASQYKVVKGVPARWGLSAVSCPESGSCWAVGPLITDSAKAEFLQLGG